MRKKPPTLELFKLAILAAMLLTLCGCIAAWTEEERLGLYPPSAAALNGPAVYFVGWQWRF